MKINIPSFYLLPALALCAILPAQHNRIQHRHRPSVYLHGLTESTEGSGFSQKGKISDGRLHCYPPETEIQDARLKKFIHELETAIQKRDTNRLLSYCEENIIISYGGGIRGKEEFLNALRSTDSETGYSTWNYLELILDLGGDYADDEGGVTFRFPWVHCNCQGCGEDIYYGAIAIGPEVPVYEKKSTDSPVIAKLVYEQLFYDPDSSNALMMMVETCDGQISGYTLKSDLIYIFDPNLDIRKNAMGEWKIISFAGFD